MNNVTSILQTKDTHDSILSFLTIQSDGIIADADGELSKTAIGSNIFNIIEKNYRTKFKDILSVCLKNGVSLQTEAHFEFGKKEIVIIPDEISGKVNLIIYNSLSSSKKNGLEEKFNQLTKGDENDKRLTFLSKVNSILNSTLDHTKVLQSIAQLSMEFISDWCVIWLLNDKGMPEAVVSVHKDPEKTSLIKTLHEKYSADPGYDKVLFKVIETGKVTIINEGIDELKEISRNEEYFDKISELGFGSVIISPLIFNDKILGALYLVSESRRSYSSHDLEIIGNLANRAALTIENSRIYQKSVDLNLELNKKVKDLEHEITQRKRIEDELKKSRETLVKNQELLRLSEEKFSKAFISSPLALVISSFEDGSIVDVNESWEKIFKFKREEVIGKTTDELNMFSDTKERNKAREIILTKGFIRDYTLNIRTKYGDSRLASFSAEVIEIKGSKHLISIVNDITESKKAEHNLLRTERRMNTALAASGTGTYYWDLENNSIEFGENLSRMFGLNKNNSIKTLNDFIRFLYPEDIEGFLKSIKKSVDEGQNFDKQYRIVLPDGSIKWLLNKAEIFLDNSGKHRYMAGACVDITERKRIDEYIREEENRFKIITENMKELVAMVNAKGKYIYTTPSFSSVLGYSKEELLLLSPVELIHPDDLGNVNMGKTSQLTEFRVRKKNGEWVWMEGSSYSVKIRNEDVIVRVSRDITERIKNKEVLQKSEERFRQIAESIDSIFFIQDWDNNKVEYVSPAYEKIWGKKADTLLQDPLSWAELVHPEDLVRIMNDLEKYRVTGEFNNEYRIIRNDGTQRWIYTRTFPIMNADKKIYRIIGIAEDITEYKNILSESLRKTAELEAVIESIPDAVFISDRNNVKDANSIALKLFGAGSVQELNNHLSKISDYLIIKDIETGRIIKTNEDFYKMTMGGDYFPRELSIKHARSKDEFIVRTAAAPIILEEETIGIVVINTDITEQKRSESQLKGSLREKEVLLKEIHHRVKNNLQVISSLLHLQENYIMDMKALEIFRESQDRIRSMALIHEKLYQMNDLSGINFNEYALDLTNHLFNSYRNRINAVNIKIDIENIYLNIDTGVNVGLIINELVSNSLKYAFPHGRKGEIIVSIKRESSNYALSVSDNGVGFPKDLDIRKTVSLGMQLVVSLSDQLNASVSLERLGGTKFTIKFHAA